MSRWWRGRGGGEPGPGIPALALGAAAGGADLPAPLVLQQRRDGLRAGQLRARGQGEGEVRRHPQHVRLAVRPRRTRAAGCSCRTPRRRRRSRSRMPSAYASVQMSMASCPLVRNSRSSGSPMTRDLHRVLDVLAGNPLPGADQRVPGPLPHVGQVHGVDPVGHPARAPQVLAFDSRRGLAGLFLPGLVDRADHQPAPPPAPRRLLQPGHREPAHHAHRGGGVPARVVQQPLRPVRRPVPAMPGDAPPVHPRQLAGQRRHVLARLQPRLGPGKARPQQPQQLIPFPQRQPGAYPDGSGRL